MLKTLKTVTNLQTEKTENFKYQWYLRIGSLGNGGATGNCTIVAIDSIWSVIRQTTWLENTQKLTMDPCSLFGIHLTCLEVLKLWIS